MKKLILLLLLLCPGLLVAQGTFADNFNRADGAGIGSAWTIWAAGNPQVLEPTAFSISGNKAVFSGYNPGVWEYATHGGLCNDQVVTATITDTANFHEVHARGAMGGAIDRVNDTPNAIEFIVDGRHSGTAGVDTIRIDYENTGASVGFDDWTGHTWSIGSYDRVDFPPALNVVQAGDIMKLTVSGANVSASITRSGVEYVMGSGVMDTVDGVLPYPTAGTAGFAAVGADTPGTDNFSVVSTGTGCGSAAQQYAQIY